MGKSTNIKRIYIKTTDGKIKKITFFKNLRFYRKIEILALFKFDKI